MSGCLTCGCTICHCDDETVPTDFYIKKEEPSKLGSNEQEIERLKNRCQILFLNIDVPRTELILKLEKRDTIIKDLINAHDNSDHIDDFIEKFEVIINRARTMLDEEE